MYDTKFVCTYHTPEVFLDTDNVTEDEKEFIRNTIYRQELLYILGMDEYNEKRRQDYCIFLFILSNC